MLLLNIRPSDLADTLKMPFLRYIRRRQTIRYLTRARTGKVEKMVSEAASMLDASGRGEQIRIYRWISLGLAGFGFLFGIVMRSSTMALVLAASLAVLPLAFIRLRTSDYRKYLLEKLETAMGAVTNSYIATGDLESAVENVIRVLPEPADAFFRRYLTEIRLISGSQRRALEHLRNEADIWYWREWVGALIQCQEDKGLRFSLPALVERMSEQRQLTIEADSVMKKQLADYLLIVLVVLGSIPLMGFMLPEWYTLLMTTSLGKLLLSAALAIILITSLWVTRAILPSFGEEESV